MILHDRYLLNGCFFQETSGLGLATLPIEGVVATIKRGMARFIFFGVIERTVTDLCGQYRGWMKDDLGEAVLEEVVLDYQGLRFTKRYTGGNPHGHPILYKFGREAGDIWNGRYELPAVGLAGESNCTLVPISHNLFLPRAMWTNPNMVVRCD